MVNIIAYAKKVFYDKGSCNAINFEQLIIAFRLLAKRYLFLDCRILRLYEFFDLNIF